jgi:hypothetical protein
MLVLDIPKKIMWCFMPLSTISVSFIGCRNQRRTTDLPNSFVIIGSSANEKE